jgi:hypothetical protein
MTTRVVNVRDYKPYNKYWYSDNRSIDIQQEFVYIGRAVRFQIPISSKWKNRPLKDKNDMNERKEAIRWYKEEHLPNSGLINQVSELKGKILGCWCKPLPCHGDVLVELADKT